MMYQTIILDMDGTLLNEVNRVSDRVINYLKELRKSGKYVFIATGRTLNEVTEVLPDDLEVDGMVTANGMSVFIHQEKLVEHALPPFLVRELVEKASDRAIYYEVHSNVGTRFTLKQDRGDMFYHTKDPKPDTIEENEWFSRKLAVKEKIDWRDHLNPEKISKIYFFSKNMKLIEEWKSELDLVKKKVAFTSTSSTEHNVEVMVANVSKATGIQNLLDHFALSQDEVMAVGDGENDLPMFKLASYSVAMKNASDVVKKQVDDVTDYSYKEDGLYHFLKKTF
ncbi:Cof-type HAD-IIB family hydrolase [Bacillus sp. Cs-700]|uniref:Cof-type HAD-IIB family hydrolase n=1 Tax=Bacillus sp. Cs-700 TaxID=2589818 RepID=UPI0014090CE7|nr:Cof-type HAD-IIB family hydrolase [Bacillus sp. Cs-700]